MVQVAPDSKINERFSILNSTTGVIWFCLMEKRKVRICVAMINENKLKKYENTPGYTLSYYLFTLLILYQSYRLVSTSLWYKIWIKKIFIALQPKLFFWWKCLCCNSKKKKNAYITVNKEKENWLKWFLSVSGNIWASWHLKVEIIVA